jgi:Protein of unknown function (DUF3047)
MPTSIGTLLLLGLCWSARSLAQGPPEPGADLLTLSAAPNATLPSGWATRAVRGQQLPMSRIVDTSGIRFMRVSGAGKAGWFFHQLATPLRATGGHLRWTWRAPLSPHGANIAASATDDAALRVFVVFGRHGRFDRRPRTLFYTLADGEPAPDDPRSPFAVRIAGRPALAREWVRAAADPFADYRRIWGTTPQPIVAIGVMQDTDQTRSAAIGDILTISWSRADASYP